MSYKLKSCLRTTCSGLDAQSRRSTIQALRPALFWHSDFILLLKGNRVHLQICDSIFSGRLFQVQLMITSRQKPYMHSGTSSPGTRVCPLCWGFRLVSGDLFGYLSLGLGGCRKSACLTKTPTSRNADRESGLKQTPYANSSSTDRVKKEIPTQRLLSTQKQLCSLTK